MSQDYSNSKRARRAARSQRNKPILVTTTDNEVGNIEDERSTIGTATQTIDEPNPLVVPAPEPVEQPARRLPRFFSNVKKSEEDTDQKEAKEAEVVQARLARATRGKAGTEVSPSKAVTVEGKKATPATSARPAPAKPQGMFKTRYIIGMGVYLIAADFLGLYVQKLLVSLGMEKELVPPITLFGGKFHIMTSTIVFLALLVIILVLLARFDLIPRSLGGTSSARGRLGQPQTRGNGTTTQGERVIPPTTRQGVKGADDTLYQQYRNNQRKKK